MSWRTKVLSSSARRVEAVMYEGWKLLDKYRTEWSTIHHRVQIKITSATTLNCSTRSPVMNGRQNNIQAAFSPYAQGSSALQRIALDAMKYNKNERPSPEEIHNRITNIQGSVRLSNSGNQQASEAWCCWLWGPRILLEAAPVGEIDSQAQYRILSNACTSFKLLLARIQRIFHM